MRAVTKKKDVAIKRLGRKLTFS